MTAESRTPAAIRAGFSPAIVRRLRWIVALVVLAPAVFAASAQAHTVTATATCNSVTFHWTAFASSGGGNGGFNTPGWNVVFTPTGGSATTKSGNVSFGGSSYSLTVAIPGGNGNVTASSAWTSAQTRDGHSSSWSKVLTISNCPPPPPPPPVTPPVPPGPRQATPTLSTTSSGNVALGEAIHDTALLSGGSSATGTITFGLYLASDTTCSTVLDTGSVAVNGDGSYDSPLVTPPSAGAYQWVATYSGNANNAPAATACNDPNEQSSIAQVVVKASCVASPVVLRGLSAKVRRSVSVHVTAVGVKSVTFYLDGRKVATVKPKNQRFSIKISARRLGYGHHRLQAKAKMSDASCAAAAAAAAFVKVRTPTIRPKFTG